MSTSTQAPPVAPIPVEPLPTMSLRRYTTLVGWGLLVTTLGQMVSIGDMPLKFMLKDQLHVTPVEMATWFFWAILPWSFKPIAGLITDGIPILGTRRRYYLLFSATLAGGLWLLMGLVPRTYRSLMFTAFAFNIMAVLASVVIGGLLVEGARSHGATGRLSSLRLIIINTTAIIAGPVSGFLAGRWFGWTTLAGGMLFFSLVPVTLLLLREPRVVQTNEHPLRGVYRQLKSVLSCKNLWICGGLFFLVQVSPGLNTPLFYYQTNVLKFEPQFLGWLMLVGGVMGLAGSFIYPLVCRKYRLRILLALAILCTTLTTLAYLGYVSRTSAIMIEGIGALGVTLAQLPLFDLAARATPKGSEALGYSMMIAFWNIGLAISNVLGSYLYDHFHLTFRDLVWVNAGTTAAVLLVIPFLPGYLVDRKEGQSI